MATPRSILAGTSIVLALGVLGVVAAGPARQLLDLLGLPVAAHAGTATGLLLVASATVPLAFLVFLDNPAGLPALRYLVAAEALFALGAVVFGHWLFVRSSYGTMLQYAKPLHRTLFEFKRLAAFVPFPLATAATAALWRWPTAADRRTRALIALMLAMAFLYTGVAFGLGAVSTRLRNL